MNAKKPPGIGQGGFPIGEDPPVGREPEGLAGAAGQEARLTKPSGGPRPADQQTRTGR